MYRERMNSYFPEVVRTIEDFQAIINSEYPEFEGAELNSERVMDNAYLLTMGEERIKEWEKILSIKPLEDSSIDDRRETVIARIRGQGKLNTALINIIVNTFTGGTANSWVENSVLYVVITPPPKNKQYRFENVEQEISKKVPAHLGFRIDRNYFQWSDIRKEYTTWQDVKDGFDTWEDVYLYVPFSRQG